MILVNNKKFGRPAARWWLLAATLLPLFGWLFSGAAGVRAEGFIEPAFEQQWRATDEAVARGQVSRTYFWGPQPFAHTSEVYAEAPAGGQRRVQYFDKARMELSKRPGFDPNLVTNGLLTVELVSGRMQVGDNKFLDRAPATNPVAGDQVGNTASPTYASFRQGRLAFGQADHQPASDRTGQPVVETVDPAGQVGTLPTPPRNMQYARYYGQTGHNVASIFWDFFQAAPLGADKWLDVMGYPITEPFWIKNKVPVAGQPRDVLVQLFQRRALTFTPDNPAGFQVEMGNIGQHYYVWRYGFDVRDQLPGNYRVIVPQGRSLLSSGARTGDTRPLGDAPADIRASYPLKNGKALAATRDKLYLADLTRARAFQELPLPPGYNYLEIKNVSEADNGRKFALSLETRTAPTLSLVMVYETGGLGPDNIKVVSSYAAYTDPTGPVKLSADGALLAHVGADNQGAFLQVMTLETRFTERYRLPDTNLHFSSKVNLQWVAGSHRALVSAGAYNFVENDGTTRFVNGKVFLVDVPSGQVNKLLETDRLREARVSPDGNYLAALSLKEPPFIGAGSLITSILTFRRLNNPSVEIAAAHEQGTSGRQSYEPNLGEWSDDGTYILVHSWASGTAGAQFHSYKLVSLVTGAVIQSNDLNNYHLSVLRFKLAGDVFTLKSQYIYNGPDALADVVVTVQNLDGTEGREVYRAKVQPNLELSQAGALHARLAQVPQG